MQNFEYLAPTSLNEAISLLTRYEGKATLMAGGTDLLPMMKDKMTEPEAIIDIKQITGLNGISHDNRKGLSLGPLTKIRDIETSKVIKGNFSILSQAAGSLGSVQIRNRGTIGGNICSAVPSADLPPALIGLNASVRIAARQGNSTMPLEEFFEAPRKTVLNSEEILTEINIPNMKDNSYGIFMKFSPRRAMDLALASVASVLTVDSSTRICSNIRIVLGAVAPVPMRAKRAEALIKGNKLSDSVIEEAASLSAVEAKPISDIRASAWYRREIIKDLVKLTISQAAEKIAEKVGN